MRTILRWLGLAVVASLFAVTTGGCGSSTPDPGSESKEPGIYEYADGLTQAVGILTYRDLEGGFWAIADTDDSSQVESSSNVVVLITSGAQVVQKLETMRGQYVSAVGTYDDGPSIFMAGPMLQVETISALPSSEK